TLTVDLPATDADGNALSYAARFSGPAQRAFDLDQQLGLSYMGSYYTNLQGHGERWLQGTAAQYFLLPNGELRRWRDAAYSFGSAGLVATLDAGYYANPSKLWDAKAAPTVTVNGQHLNITAAPTYTGGFAVDVTVSNGHSQTSP